MNALLTYLKPLWPHLLTPLVFLTLFTLPLSLPQRRLIYAAVFFSLFYLCFFSKLAALPPTFSPLLRLLLATTWMFYLDWLAKMVLHRSPEHDFWRVTITNDATSTGQHHHLRGHHQHHQQQPQPERKVERGKLPWAFSLLTSPRGVGWNYQVGQGGLREQRCRNGGGRWRFVLWQIVRAAGFVVLSDLISGLVLPVMVGGGSGKGGSIGGTTAGDVRIMGWWSWSWNWKKMRMLGPVLVKWWADAEAWYAACNAGLVAAGLAGEEDCRPLFGNNLASLDSLQDFWGLFVPQSFRRMFQDFGRTACRILHIRRRTELAWLVYVWVAFIISGTVHGFAFAYAMSDDVLGKHFKATFTFFILQAVGLTVETLFLETPVKDITLYEVGLEDEMIMGRIWTWGWLLMSAHYALDSWLEFTATGGPSIPSTVAGVVASLDWSRLGWYLSGDGGLLES